jgi:serine/threonine protein kinase
MSLMRRRELGNILVKENEVYLTDFGVSLDWTSNKTSATGGNPGKVTPMYSAPEVTNHEEGRTRAADVFSLGCVFSEMATVMSKRSVKDFEIFRREDYEEAFYECLGDPLKEWLGELPIYELMLEDMLAEEASKRPTTGDLLERLKLGISEAREPLVCEHRPSKTDKA